MRCKLCSPVSYCPTYFLIELKCNNMFSSIGQSSLYCDSYHTLHLLQRMGKLRKTPGDFLLIGFSNPLLLGKALHDLFWLLLAWEPSHKDKQTQLPPSWSMECWCTEATRVETPWFWREMSLTKTSTKKAKTMNHNTSSDFMKNSRNIFQEPY